MLSNLEHMFMQIQLDRTFALIEFAIQIIIFLIVYFVIYLIKYLNNKKIWDNCRDSLPYPYSENDAQ